TVQSSSFSMINQGSGFARFFPDTLKNTGTGQNYGIELTMQKFFSKSFYVLATVSVYDSKYRGSDGILRNTSYNGLYTANVLAGKEFKIGTKHIIGIGAKVTVAGGKRYGYVDLTKTTAAREIIFSDSLFNERQFRDYFRADIKVSWKMNAKKVTHEIGLDFVNILNTKNILSLAYAPNLADPSKEPIAQKTQLGFLPLFYYRISFKLAGKKQ
ncbi:MAG TPA: TonB-dependent receptor, partial [Fluviicola sp.]|nr:TonB-dependent receptor [Fluviicola sp.]